MSKNAKVAVLLLSDIHYSDVVEESRFAAREENDFSTKFEIYLREMIKEKDIKIKYVVITGDLVESGKRNEYEIFQKILLHLFGILEIDKKNVLIIPGNHDINRVYLENYCDENRILGEEAKKLYDIKLRDYVEFYKSFFEIEEYDISKCILSKIHIEENNTEILGVNTLSIESYRKEDHAGFIETRKFQEEFNRLSLDSTTNIIVAAHHSFTNCRGRELATVKNAEIAKDEFAIDNINTYIYGHHHTSESKLEQNGDKGNRTYRFIEVGSLGKVFTDGTYTNRFSLLDIVQDGFFLHDYIYSAENWMECNDTKYKHKITFGNNKKISRTPISEVKTGLPEEEDDDSMSQNGKMESYIESVHLSEKSQEFVDFLKTDGFYIEGHFHWKNGLKTLGWINIAGYLGNINIIIKIRDAIVDLQKKYFNDIQAVIGYGIEGNIMGSSLASYYIDNTIKYFYYPSVHKDTEYNSVEKKLWNEYNEFENMAIIFDFIPDSGYLKEIIESNQQLCSCKKLHIVSLFYNRNISKQNSSSIYVENINDGMKYKIEIDFYAIAMVDVPVCAIEKEKCLIYNNKIKKAYDL